MTSCDARAACALAITLGLAACGGGGSAIPREPDEYVGCATDENWQTFDTTPDTISDAQSPLITAPSAGGISGSVPPTFSWQQSSTVVGTPAGDVPMTCAQWNEGFTELHLPPISGDVFDLQISYDGAVQHRVLTTLQQWTASAEVWQKIAGHTMSLVIRRMLLVENEPQAGPFIPTGPTDYSVGSN